MPIISIIVPVYKAEAYLHRCVDSLLAQTFADFEVLLIDDGSPDGSGVICDAYAAMDKRVRAFHIKNGGVSVARQFGIDHALGEYTIHADPDDWVDPTMLEELYRKACETDTDIVIADFFVNESTYCKQNIKETTAKAVLQQLLFQQLHGSCWNKLVKRVCYSTFNVKFPPGLNYSEDFLVCVQLLIHDQVKIAYLPKAFYHYDQIVNGNSISRKYTRQTYEQRCLFLKELKRYTSDYVLTQRNIVLEAIQNGVLRRSEFYHDYDNEIGKMLQYGHFGNKREMLPVWALKYRLFGLAILMLKVSDLFVRLHLKMLAK